MICIRDRIIKAVIEEIQLKGVKFPLDNLAKQLGISKKTLYKYFSSKVEMLDAVIDYTFEDMDKKAIAIIENDQLSLIEKIKGVITVLPDHYEFIDQNILDQIKRYYPEQWIKMDTLLKSDWELLRNLIEQGIREGVIINRNVSLIMKVIIESINSTLNQKFYLENRITVPEALSEIVDILLYGISTKNKR
ncbi:transcriptional regulator, TetR family [Peribacillus simplex]|uniref:Transcriptional regulator, TetR family n=1 Tax=Peribacillus simplex TaxID=1478 RepID=A0A9X8RCI9_9BACI|nr:TetR/AcrR family transcriptional regulator [Peribacillus simplex]SIR87926.1 transcriptional regulator, TetR family [Peribacillus simplex]